MSANGTLVFLHCSTGSSAQWRKPFEHYSDRFHVIAPDLYGYGNMGAWHHRRALTLDDELEIVSAVFETLDHPVHLVGHSYGGAIALHTALRFPGRIKSLCLIEPVAFHLLFAGEMARGEAAREIGSLASDIEVSVISGFPLVAARRFVDYWNGKGTWVGLKVATKQAISKMMVKVCQDFQAVLTEPTQANAYKSIGAPTLILSGTLSPEPTRYIAQRLNQLIPGSRWHGIKGAGHMVPVSHPVQVNAAIDAHLRQVMTSSGQLAA